MCKVQVLCLDNRGYLWNYCKAVGRGCRAGLVEQFLPNLTDLFNGASDFHYFFTIRKIVLSAKNGLGKKNVFRFV